eukprot:scaffold71571_cov66-Phaeocystis_antarctica.AAC.5
MQVRLGTGQASAGAVGRQGGLLRQRDQRRWQPFCAAHAGARAGALHSRPADWYARPECAVADASGLQRHGQVELHGEPRDAVQPHTRAQPEADLVLRPASDAITLQDGDGVQLRAEPLARTSRAGGRAQGNRHAATRADVLGRHARLHLLAHI